MTGRMNLRPRPALALCLAAVSLLACQGGGGDDVAAVVDGYQISTADLDRYFLSQVGEQAGPPSEDQARMMRLSLLNEIIDRQILLQKAESLGLMANDEEVDQRFQQYRAPFETDADFQTSLEQQELTREDLRAEIRRTLTIEKLLNREISSRVEVSEAEMRQYYEANKASFALAELRLHLAQIVVTPTPETPVPNLLNDDAVDEDTAKKKIRMIEDRLGNGEDFSTLAQNYSEDPSTASTGGDLGFIPQSSLEKADITLRRVVAALAPGENSPVIETGGQYRIIRLLDKEQPGQRDFSDPRVQQSIRDTLTNGKDQLLKTAYLEMLRTQANVTNLYAQRIVGSFGVSD
ncbi:MAG: SurA N-terminal domain-containing protein [Bryobacterales bacterium]